MPIFWWRKCLCIRHQEIFSKMMQWRWRWLRSNASTITWQMCSWSSHAGIKAQHVMACLDVSQWCHHFDHFGELFGSGSRIFSSGEVNVKWKIKNGYSPSLRTHAQPHCSYRWCDVFIYSRSFQSIFSSKIGWHLDVFGVMESLISVLDSWHHKVNANVQTWCFISL